MQQVQGSAPSAAKPTAVTGRANKLGFTFATVHGSVNPEGSATTYYFQYGKTKNYGSKTSALSVGSGSSSQSVRRALHKLRPGTLYHYRIVAHNVNGTAFGRDRTFRTPQRPSLHVTPSKALAGSKVRVYGNADGCPRGDTVTLLSSAFSPTHEFAGVAAVYTRVKARGAFSTTTRIPGGRAARRYRITARCGGGNLDVSASLTVILPSFTG